MIKINLNDLLYGHQLYDALGKNRIITCCGEIEPRMANEIMQLLFVYQSKDPTKPINMYINSPGGEVDSGFQIIDTMSLISAPVHTVATGICASMACLVLSAGAKRAALPHARIMIHQVSAGYQGKAAEIEASAKETIRRNEVAMSFLARNCNKTYEQLMENAKVDFWLTAEEALEYGIIDQILGRKDVE